MSPCNLCGASDSHTILRTARLDGPLLRCGRCGFAYVDSEHPRFLVLDGQDQDARGQTFGRINQVAQAELHLDPAVEALEQSVRRRTHLHRLEEIKRFRQKGSLLEIGCGRGEFLELARLEGYSVHGVEPHPQHAAHARGVLGLDVFPGTLSEAFLKDESFDLVVLFHVIEHLRDPSREINRVWQVLKQKGLVVIETPNINTIWFTLLGKRWRQLIPEHYFLFSESTIRRLLESYRFRMLEIKSIGKFVSVRLLLNRLQRMFGGVVSPLALTANLLRLGGGILYLNPGDVMIAFAEKK